MEISPLDWKSVLERVWPFFLVMVVFWLFSAFAWGAWGYEGSFRWANTLDIPILNQASLYVFTHFADGLILPSIMFILFWRKDPVLAVTAFAAIILTGLVAQFGKIVVFSDWHRPPVVFADDPLIRIFHPSPPSSRSFPSGHSTSAAAGGFFFAYFLSHWNKSLAFFAGVFAVFIGFTRVIIGVHFPGDVFIGSMIGSIGALLCLLWIYPFLNQRLGRLRRAQTGRIATIVIAGSVLIILAQFIHLYSEY